MKKKIVIWTVLVFIAFVALSGFFMISVKKQLQPVTVLVYTREIDGTSNKVDEKTIKDKDVKEITINKGSLPEGVILDMKEAVGKTVNTKVYPNTYVYSAQISDAKEDAFKDLYASADISKLRTCTIPVSLEDALAGNLKPGDRVDLNYTQKASNKDENDEEECTYTIPFKSDIWIYKVNTAEGYRYDDFTDKSYSEVEDEKEPLQLVTFVGVKEDMIELKNRSKSGTISLFGRLKESKDYNTLGHVIGDYTKVFTGFADIETNKITIDSGKVQK